MVKIVNIVVSFTTVKTNKQKTNSIRSYCNAHFPDVGPWPDATPGTRDTAVHTTACAPALTERTVPRETDTRDHLITTEARPQGEDLS